MKIVVSAAQRFHYFELAGQLSRRGQLHRLYTGYPRFKVHEVERDLVRTHALPTTLYLLAARRGLATLARRADPLVLADFDRWVARRLEAADLVVAGSGFARHTLRSARRRGALAVCDRGSAHILTQRDILREEYARFGVPFGMRGNPMHGSVVEAELAAYEEADYILVPSTFALGSFLERGVPEHKLIRLPYGVDLSVFRPLPKRDDVFRVLFVGLASLQKGVQYLLEAVSGLRLPRFEVVLVGGVADDARGVLTSYADSFRHIGFVPRLQLAEVYSQGSVLVLPSVQEGLALVQAQAMACGLPVVATPNSGAEDLFTHGEEGFIVPPRDTNALRDAIVRLYEQPQLRAEMGRGALQRVQALGGWDSYGAAAVRAFQAALGTPRPARGSAA